MKRAEFSVGYMYIIGGVIAGLIIVAYFTGILAPILEKVGLVELIPVLGLTGPVQGNGVVGVNLVSGNLEYYTGESFKKFTGQEVALLGGYEFNIEDTKNKINDFYFNTQRRPERLNMSINNWRYLEAFLSNKIVSVVFKSKNGFIGSDSASYYNFDSFNKFKFVSSTEGSLENYVSDFSNLEIMTNSSIHAQIIAWRDSILQGNKCEKFLTLKLKKNENDIEVVYTVRLVDGYLVVDLTKPISLGSIQKYDDLNCFKFDNYLDGILQPIADSFNIYLRDYFLNNREFYFSFDTTKGWTVSPNTKYIDKGWFSSEEKDRYPLDVPSLTSGNPKYSLLLGMIKIIQIAGDRGYIDSNVEFYTGSDITYVGNQMTFVNFYQKRNGFSKAEMTSLTQIIYDVLTEYNKKLVPQEMS
ncbi:MAG: hypothetical protein AABX10_04090 [Nanoarchaeota archaeon]